MEAMTIMRSIDFSRATASAIWSSSSRFALTAFEGAVVTSAHQRAVDAGRAHLEVVFAVDRILDVEHRRQIFAQPLAIGDGEPAVGVLGHDLQRAAVVLRDLHADQRIAEVVGDRLDDVRDALLEAGFADVTLFSQIESQLAPLMQKERGPV